MDASFRAEFVDIGGCGLKDLVLFDPPDGKPVLKLGTFGARYV